MLHIEDLEVEVEDVKILKKISLQVKPGEIHAIMGPNGSGKSTLAKALAGHPFYEHAGGSVTMNGQDLLEMDVPERAHAGLFVGFQYPAEVSGVTNFQFLFEAVNAHRKAHEKDEMSEDQFRDLLHQKMELLGMSDRFMSRNLNDGFSGGEKKRNEILQMLTLDPHYVVLDETDSGLDIDALRVVASGVNTFFDQGDKGILLITHYQRLLDYIKPHYVHVMVGGKIVESGGPELALQLESKGYEMVFQPS